MVKPEVIIKEDETLDDLCCSQAKILQKKYGYRFSIDAILLANFVGAPENKSIIDLGTGCGVIPIVLAKRTTMNTLVGVEIQKDLAEMAVRNVELNHLSKRIAVINEDLKNLEGVLKTESFDIVLSNPPYRQANSGRINPYLQKAVARHEITCSLKDILRISKYLLKPLGKICLIFPVTRLGELIFTLRQNNLEPKKLQIVYSHIKSEGKLALIEASKGGGMGLDVLGPLFTHEPDGTPILQTFPQNEALCL